MRLEGPRVFAGIPGRGVLISTDNGTSWTAENMGLPVYQDRFQVIRCLAVSGTSIVAGGLAYTTDTGGVFRYTNNGTNWMAVKTNFASVVVGLVASGTNLWASTWCCDYLYLSTDIGDSWRAVCPVDEYGGGGPLAKNDTYIFAGTGGYNMRGASGAGLLRRPLSEMITSVDPVTVELPREYQLEQNYPNPMNPSTTINYTLPNRSHVTLTVFNTLGQSVSTLVNGDMEAGYHEVKFDGGGLASGVYFYRLSAGGFVNTRKLTILK
jgi:hypothetical protein